MRVAQHLKKWLEVLEAVGLIEGEIILVRMANPLGFAHNQQGILFSRFDLTTGINFYRHYRHVTAALIPLIEPLLGADAEANTRVIRKASMDADFVRDLHCDTPAVRRWWAPRCRWPPT